MSADAGLLAVIPARGGSKGLPGKNIKPFAGLPLIAHSILLAKMCPEIDRCIISTDSPEIAEVARRFEADVPFLRPAELAQDETPMWPVLRHALEAIETTSGIRYQYLLLLDPTSPYRLPSDITAALERLRGRPEADGIIGVSQPDFNPMWHCVVESSDGWMADLMPEGARYTRRQDVPAVYRINGALYLWRTALVRTRPDGWRGKGKHLLYEIPDVGAISIDTPEEFERAELLVRHGMIQLPWLSHGKAVPCAR